MDRAVDRAIAARLREDFGARARFDEPLRRHTSFRIGGPADVLVEVESAEEIHRLQCLAVEAGVPLIALGGGTNVLVGDGGVRGILLKLGRTFRHFDWQETGDSAVVYAGAAAPFKRLVSEAARRGWSGLEFAEGIPGSIGGGLLMNAGAFGGEISDAIVAIVGVSPERGEHHRPRAELRFGYRFFDLPRGLVVTRVDFELGRDAPEAIRERIAHAKSRRERHQPLGMPNAGSVFKNPPGHHAGKLIESVGMKGRRVGGAMVSDRHANFIVNAGNASAADVRRLMEEIGEAVWTKHGVRLEPEIKLVGEWAEAAS